MSRKITDDEIGKEIKKALKRLEDATEIIKALNEYLDNQTDSAKVHFLEVEKYYNEDNQSIC